MEFAGLGGKVFKMWLRSLVRHGNFRGIPIVLEAVCAFDADGFDERIVERPATSHPAHVELRNRSFHSAAK